MTDPSTTSQTDVEAIYRQLKKGLGHELVNDANVFELIELVQSRGDRLLEVELRQTNNIVVWIIDGAVICLRTNTSAFTSGNVMLGFMDTFNSIAAPAQAFVLFDNVRVESRAPPIRFTSITRPPNGHVILALTSALGDSFWLETSTNLTTWQPLANLFATNQPLQFTDTTSASALRYYRTRR